jgi:hypothetical protein
MRPSSMQVKKGGGRGWLSFFRHAGRLGQGVASRLLAHRACVQTCVQGNRFVRPRLGRCSRMLAGSRAWAPYAPRSRQAVFRRVQKAEGFTKRAGRLEVGGSRSRARRCRVSGKTAAGGAWDMHACYGVWESLRRVFDEPAQEGRTPVPWLYTQTHSRHGNCLRAPGPPWGKRRGGGELFGEGRAGLQAAVGSFTAHAGARPAGGGRRRRRPVASRSPRPRRRRCRQPHPKRSRRRP